MRHANAFLFLILVCSCSGKPSEVSFLSEHIIPDTFVLESSKNILVKNDTVLLAGRKYSGFLYQMYADTRDTSFRAGYYNGLLDGVFKKWYPQKQVMEERYYLYGRKNGPQVSYWENGYKRFEFVAVADAYEGELKEYNAHGRLIHLANYKDGQEEGTQKMWYDNGKIRANYVIIHGKRYGLLGTKNCRNVSDSIFVVR